MSQWAQLAAECDDMASYYESRGEHGSARVQRIKAETYRQTVRAMEMEDQSGHPHCTCCLKRLS